LNPLLAGGAALGAKATGYVAHVEAEGYARVSHLAGQAAHATGQLLSDGTRRVKHGFEKGVHAYADTIQSRVHQGEAKLVQVIDHVSAALSRAEKAVNSAEHAYTKPKHSVSRGVNAVEHTASQAYGTLSHPGEWFHSDPSSPEKQTHPSTATLHAQQRPNTLAKLCHPSNDPRHADNPHHKLYLQLKERIGEASENRLLQFTDACNAKGISHGNLGEIAFDRQGGHVIFRSSSVGPMATVDVKEPSPQSAQSLQHIQQVDQMQTNIQTHMQAQNAQQHAQGQAPSR
jgi:hypothetical protein